MRRPCPCLSPKLASAASLFYGVATDDVQLVWCLLSVKAAVAAARPLSAYIRPQTVTGTASRSFSNAPCSARPGAWRASRRRGALLPSGHRAGFVGKRPITALLERYRQRIAVQRQ